MVEKFTTDWPDKFAIATSVTDVKDQFAQGLISLPMGMENGAPVEGDLENLRHFFNRGVRYITLTHGKYNHICDSSYDPERHWNGLRKKKKKVVTEMNRLGMMIDISHVSDSTFYQVMELTKAPVIASHSSCRKFTPGWERNMSDDMIVKLAQQGGVIQINFGSAFLTKEASEWAQTFFSAREKYLEENGLAPNSEEASAFQTEYRKQHPLPYAELDDVLDHFDHVVELTGIDHVGIGSDFDGVGDSLPEGIKDVSQFPNLIDGLLARGYSKRQIKKILGGNVLRVWSKVENHAAKYQ
ncbi:MAG: dipeptidase [Gammaproteobacteria bacterium]|nr:dipeptidase [Gammaproteobacteria bacterium]